MRKFGYIVAILLFATTLFGSDEFKVGFEATIKDNFKHVKNVEILNVDDLNSSSDLKFVIAKLDDDLIATFATSDAKSLMALSDFMVIGNDEDKKLIEKRMESAKAKMRAGQEEIVYELIKTIPEDRFISIESFNPDNKFTTYMITDPECPYCRDEIDRMVKWLRNANVKIIFAPVHGKSAYTKSVLMLNESKKIKADDQESMIKLLNKYYDKNATVDNSLVSDEERDKVLEDAKKLFSKGAIKGVPFSFTIENR